MPARLTAPDARRDRRIPRKKAAFAGKPSLSTALEKTCTVCATGTVRAPRLDAAAHNKVTTWSRSRGSTVSARRALMNRRPTSTRYCWVAGAHFCCYWPSLAPVGFSRSVRYRARLGFTASPPEPSAGSEYCQSEYAPFYPACRITRYPACRIHGCHLDGRRESAHPPLLGGNPSGQVDACFRQTDGALLALVNFLAIEAQAGGAQLHVFQCT